MVCGSGLGVNYTTELENPREVNLRSLLELLAVRERRARAREREQEQEQERENEREGEREIGRETRPAAGRGRERPLLPQGECCTQGAPHTAYRIPHTSSASIICCAALKGHMLIKGCIRGAALDEPLLVLLHGALEWGESPQAALDDGDEEIPRGGT